jgi:hypothetical protein
VAEILMSDQVRNLLGDQAEYVASVSLAGGHCPVCRENLDPAGPATVLVVRSPHTTNVAYAHPDCVALDVIDISDEEMAAAWTDGGLQMTVTAALVGHGQALLPTLVAELDGWAFAHGAAGQLGDVTNLVVSTLLELGFALVSRIHEPPRKVAGWSAVLRPGAGAAVQLKITDSHSGVFYEGTVYPPMGWLDEAQRYGWIVGYSGAVRLGGNGEAWKILRTTAAGGGLVGGRVPITWRPS